MNDNMDKTIYLITLQTYLEKNNCLNDSEKQKELFPSNWNTITDYHLKAEIINEALTNNIKVEETKLYLNNVK